MRTIQILYAVIFEIDDPMHPRRWSVGSIDLVIPAAHVKKEALFENHLLAVKFDLPNKHAYVHAGDW